MVKKIKTLQIGKNGLTPAIVEQVKGMMVDVQIMKISILKSACKNKEEAILIADSLINSLGKNFTYKLIGHTINLRKWRKDMR